MAKENAVFDEKQNIESILSDSFDFDELEEKLLEQLDEEFEEIECLKEEKEMIANPDNLGEVIQGVVWDQFINQIAATAGDEFIAENRGLTLDLRDNAHIQTAENFAAGEIATHNHISREQLEQNYDRYKNKPHKEFRDEYVDPGMNATLKRAGELNKQGVETVTDIYTGKQIPTKTKLENGKNNPEAAQREHVKSSAELYKNPALQMGTSNEELAGIINNPENLQGYTTAERNNRKSDLTADEMQESDKTKHWEKANKRAEEYVESEENKIKERLTQEGRKTQKEEAFRISKSAVKAVVMQLLAELIREIISKLVKWFKSTKRNLDSLLESLKEAIQSFVGKLKMHVINAGHTVFVTIARAIGEKVFNTVRRVCTILKQGWKSLKDAVNYLRSPENKGKPIGRLILETGKIVIAGMTGIGAMFLSEAIEDALTAVPIMTVEIPLFGSLANILGVFFGAVVAGIIGAIAINLIEKRIEKDQKAENTEAQLNKGNEILRTQHQLQAVGEAKLAQEKFQKAESIKERHQKANDVIRESLDNIADNCKEDDTIDDMFADIDNLFEELEED